MRLLLTGHSFHEATLLTIVLMVTGGWFDKATLLTSMLLPTGHGCGKATLLTIMLLVAGHGGGQTQADQPLCCCLLIKCLCTDENKKLCPTSFHLPPAILPPFFIFVITTFSAQETEQNRNQRG